MPLLASSQTLSTEDLVTVPSKTLKNALIVKNLSPYSVTGTYSPPSGAINYETSLSNFSVIDSPNNLNILSPTNYYVINSS